MLHILLLILKIIGIILAVILGILVLLVCIVLFVPVRYEADGVCKGDFDSLKGKIKVTWLFHLVRADIYYKEKKLKWRVRIAWKKLTGGEHFGDSGEENESREGKKDEQKEENGKELKRMEQAYETGEEKEEKDSEKVQETEKIQTVERTEEIAEAGKEERLSKDEKADGQEDTEREEELKESREEKNDKEDAGERKKNQGLHEIIKSLWNRLLRFWHTLNERFGKIQCTIRNICDKIKELLEKKEKLTDFITEEAHTDAFVKIRDEAFRLLRNLKPKELKVKTRFGFENPQRTGQVLAFLAVLYPFAEDNIEVMPDFENKVLKGTVHIKGHVRVCHFAACACRLLLRKNVRVTYKDMKNFEW